MKMSDVVEVGADDQMDVLALEGETAADYLEELLDIADLDGDIDTYVEAGRPHVSILTSGDKLVGPNGEVLEALQDLSRLAVLTKLGRHSRLMLDVAGHREKRRQEIQEIVAAAVAELQSTGESQALEAMNPFERKIVHDAVAEAGLHSESEGEADKRHVVISRPE
ncbi:MAG: single-stranded DNA-binding protein [Propionibacteriaceae bacterium]|nr:single-stranded DNA-binding protein [Propionibacteriaceae bacterium]